MPPRHTTSFFIITFTLPTLSYLACLLAFRSLLTLCLPPCFEPTHFPPYLCVSLPPPPLPAYTNVRNGTITLEQW